jgi:FkbM family methyltransferase
VGERGRVLAIEPSSRESERLVRNLQVNSVSNVRLVRKAVSDCSASAELLVAADVWSGHNTLGAFSYDTPLAIKEKVQTERLDAIVAEAGLARVDVIKMDVEGAEVRVLRGAVEALDRFRPLLLIEFADAALGHQGGSSAQIWDFLEGHRYRICEFDARTGAPVPAQRKSVYDGENLIAVPDSCTPDGWPNA